MLMLTRKAGESIVIGNSIRVTVVSVGSSSITLGFEAPTDVSIYREELYKEIVEANKTASAAGATGDDSDPEPG